MVKHCYLVKSPAFFVAISRQKYLAKCCDQVLVHTGQNRTESGERRKKQFEKITSRQASKSKTVQMTSKITISV